MDMSGDLDARVVQAAREAVCRDWPELATWWLSGEYDSADPLRGAILGARAALAEIERDYVLERRT
jgi:hypothetical protein